MYSVNDEVTYNVWDNQHADIDHFNETEIEEIEMIESESFYVWNDYGIYLSTLSIPLPPPPSCLMEFIILLWQGMTE